MSTGKDYYKVLNVEADASFQDIAKSFRVLAITHHPLKNEDTMAQSNFKFVQVCEAFEVLSTRKENDRYEIDHFVYSTIERSLRPLRRRNSEERISE